jgi:hypothetical protein
MQFGQWYILHMRFGFDAQRQVVGHDGCFGEFEADGEVSGRSSRPATAIQCAAAAAAKAGELDASSHFHCFPFCES